MASRIAEVVYKLRDLFTGPAKRVGSGYDEIRRSSRKTADAVERNESRTRAAITRTQAALGKFTSTWRSLTGLVAAGSAVAGMRAFVDSIDRVGKSAAKLGVTTEELSKLSFAAEKSGVSAQQFEVAVQRLVRKTGDAVNGLGEAQKAFENFGIDAEAFAKLNLEDKIAELSVAFNSIGDRSEALSALQKLVDSEGLGLAVLLEQGPSGIKALTDELERLGGVVRADLAADAAKLADALTTMEGSAKGAAFTLGGPVVQALNLIAGNFGLNTNEVANLSAQLEVATFQYNLANESLGETSSITRKYAGEVSRLTRLLREATAEGEKNRIEAEKEAAAREAQLKANKAYRGELEHLSKQYADLSKARIAAIEEETKELEAARNQQLSIEREFQSLVDAITRPTLNPEDVSLGDVFLKQRQAAAAAERGDGEQAIKLAREGGDLLGLLKEKGTETAGTLKFLAEQLKRVAVEAAGKETDKEGTELDAAKAAFSQVQQQADILKATAPAAGSEYALAFINAMRAEFEKTTIPAPQVAEPAVPQIKRDGNSFSYGTDYRREIEKRGVK